MPASYLRVPGSDPKLKLLTPASCYVGPWRQREGSSSELLPLIWENWTEFPVAGFNPAQPQPLQSFLGVNQGMGAPSLSPSPSCGSLPHKYKDSYKLEGKIV